MEHEHCQQITNTSSCYFFHHHVSFAFPSNKEKKEKLVSQVQCSKVNWKTKSSSREEFTCYFFTEKRLQGRNVVKGTTKRKWYQKCKWCWACSATQDTEKLNIQHVWSIGPAAHFQHRHKLMLNLASLVAQGGRRRTCWACLTHSFFTGTCCHPLSEAGHWAGWNFHYIKYDYSYKTP